METQIEFYFWTIFLSLTRKMYSWWSPLFDLKYSYHLFASDVQFHLGVNSWTGRWLGCGPQVWTRKLIWGLGWRGGWRQRWNLSDECQCMVHQIREVDLSQLRSDVSFRCDGRIGRRVSIQNHAIILSIFLFTCDFSSVSELLVVRPQLPEFDIDTFIRPVKRNIEHMRIIFLSVI